jgi:hypothetical protein
MTSTLREAVIRVGCSQCSGRNIEWAVDGERKGEAPGDWHLVREVAAIR